MIAQAHPIRRNSSSNFDLEFQVEGPAIRVRLSNEPYRTQRDPDAAPRSVELTLSAPITPEGIDAAHGADLQEAGFSISGRTLIALIRTAS